MILQADEVRPVAEQERSELAPPRLEQDDSRRHPDLFNAAQAVAYLRLDSETGERTLETLRTTHGLQGQKMGRGFMYHRRYLDSFVDRMFGTADPVVRRAAR